MKIQLQTSGVAALAFSAGMVVSFFTLPVWVATLVNEAKQGSRTDWLGFAGSIIGSMMTAVVAAIAIYYAWRGVRHQMRIGLIGREEERIERILPGLKFAAGHLGALINSIRMTSASNTWNRICGFVGVEDGEDDFDTKFGDTFKSVDEATKGQILVHIQSIIESARQVTNAERTILSCTERLDKMKAAGVSDLDDMRAKISRAMDDRKWNDTLLKSMRKDLVEFHAGLEDKIELFEGRLKKFRPQLEAFFDEKD